VNQPITIENTVKWLFALDAFIFRMDRFIRYRSLVYIFRFNGIYQSDVRVSLEHIVNCCSREKFESNHDHDLAVIKFHNVDTSMIL